MKAFKVFALAVVAVVVIAAGFFTYMGVFSTPAAAEKVMGPYTLVYDSYVGDYKETGKVFDRIHNSLAADGITATKGIGIYYDNPSKTPKDQLRSDCGSVLEEKDSARVAELEKKYKVKMIPQQESVVTEFPVRNVLSYMIGPMKAYPALMQYAQQKGYKSGMMYELYDMPAKKIYFVMEIAK